MAVYYSVKCPNCNREVESGKDRTTQYGSPFRKCRHCGHIYVDTNYIEPGVMDEKDLYKRHFSWGGLLYIAIGLLLLYGGWIYSKIVGVIIGLAVLILGVIVIIGSVKYKPEEDEKLARELQASKERLSNPHYIIALWEAGCHISVELLDWAKKAVAENAE